MLEANTDRMWFTIGSILIGAALVTLGRNGLERIGDNIIGEGGQLDSMLQNVTTPD